MKTKSQLFSDTVFPNVQAMAGTDKAAKYKTLCKKAGSLVRNSGLMQTLAFFRARAQKNGEQHHQDLLDQLEQEMRQLNLIESGKTLYKVVQQAQLPQYMVLTRETLRLLTWHKRLCETLIISQQNPPESLTPMEDAS